jgi:hypothetical protein
MPEKNDTKLQLVMNENKNRRIISATELCQIRLMKAYNQRFV